MTVGIIGYGVVGHAVAAFHRGRGDVVFTYDKATDGPEARSELDSRAEVVFVCVGTPSNEDGQLDCSAVFNAVSWLAREHTVIVKSTVMPGTCDALAQKCPEQSIFFVPEFLDEATAAADYASPRRPHVVGYTSSADRSAFVDLLPHHKRVSSWLPARQAELLKLATNTFYALKVSFANMLYDCGASQEMLDALALDPRIAPSHFTVKHKGYRGYGGHCLCKDSEALERLADTGKPSHLRVILETMRDYNESLRHGKD